MKAMTVIGLSLLPYFHELITTKDIGPKSWVPDLGLKHLLTDSEGYILGFSNYRVFLYTFLIHIFFLTVWTGWLSNAKKKPYYYALYIPVILSIFQIALIIFNLRYSVYNDVAIKIYFVLAMMFVLGVKQTRSFQFTPKIFLQWALIIIASILPFIHDVLTERGTGLRGWAPNLGIEKVLTGADAKILGFKTYRVFIYTFAIHLFAHIGALGWFMEAWKKKYRTWILVPVAITLYQLPIIVFNGTNTSFNSPGTKLYISIGLCVLLAINFYFNNKVDSPKNQSA